MWGLGGPLLLVDPPPWKDLARALTALPRGAGTGGGLELPGLEGGLPRLGLPPGRGGRSGPEDIAVASGYYASARSFGAIFLQISKVSGLFFTS